MWVSCSVGLVMEQDPISGSGILGVIKVGYKDFDA